VRTVRDVFEGDGAASVADAVEGDGVGAGGTDLDREGLTPEAGARRRCNEAGRGFAESEQRREERPAGDEAYGSHADSALSGIALGGGGALLAGLLGLLGLDPEHLGRTTAVTTGHGISLSRAGFRRDERAAN
jgi:hypothetical protein